MPIADTRANWVGNFAQLAVRSPGTIIVQNGRTDRTAKEFFSDSNPTETGLTTRS